MGGVEGMMKINEMEWKRVKNKREIVKVGEEINVKVMKLERESKSV